LNGPKKRKKMSKKNVWGVIRIKGKSESIDPTDELPKRIIKITGSSVIAQLSHDWVEYDFTALIALIYRL
jgi:hypothetical protein